MAEADDQSLKGLAKRWLKNQLKVGGDPMQGPARRREADELEWQMQHKVQEDVVSALTPKGLKDRMSEMEETRAQRQAEQEQTRRDELATRTRNVSLRSAAMPTGPSPRRYR